MEKETNTGKWKKEKMKGKMKGKMKIRIILRHSNEKPEEKRK